MITQIPSTLKILGYTWDIVITDDANLLNMKGASSTVYAGLCNKHTQTIYISKRTQGFEQQVQTLCHEIIHAIERTFDDMNTHTELTEFQIDMLGTGLASILLNNNFDGLVHSSEKKFDTVSTAPVQGKLNLEW